MMSRQVLALGGGGFLEEPDNPALDRYVLDQAHVPRPKVCFLATGRGDPAEGIAKFYRAFERLESRPSHLPLFQRTPDLAASLLDQDVIYVGGGNSKSMLAVWREWGLPALLRAAWEQGTVLAGVCAGALCWFEHGITDSCADRLTVLSGLGFVSGSCCPHYDDDERRPAFHRLLAAGEVQAGYGIDVGALVHLVDGGLHDVVASRERACAYRVEVVAGTVREHQLPTRLVADNG